MKTEESMIEISNELRKMQEWIIRKLFKEIKAGNPLPLYPKFNAKDAVHVYIQVFKPKQRKQ